MYNDDTMTPAICPKVVYLRYGCCSIYGQGGQNVERPLHYHEADIFSHHWYIIKDEADDQLHEESTKTFWFDA